ncbi:MAG: hypothetical protein BGO26_06195 [Actinobacteria bacterium 69-20]|nr:MAG: hypothetical protein BGO26_06195 [Actinobacteria bacterium 69-20]
MADTDGGQQAAANFSRNIKARREAIGMSQEHLAEAMTSRGFGFTQATVWKVESGQRGISLTEGIAIAEILGDSRDQLSLASLMRAPEIDQARQALESASVDLARATVRIEELIAAYIETTKDYAAAYRIATDRTPEKYRTGAVWQWAEPTAPELIALAARLRDETGDDDAALDAVTTFERLLIESGWPWRPWQPEGITKVVVDDGEHHETS